jgi:hypothetical protein
MPAMVFTHFAILHEITHQCIEQEWSFFILEGDVNIYEEAEASGSLKFNTDPLNRPSFD